MTMMSDDWGLDPDQMRFMYMYHTRAARAYRCADMETLRAIESAPEYHELFGAMTWDEAYDRYEETFQKPRNTHEALIAAGLALHEILDVIKEASGIERLVDALSRLLRRVSDA